MFNMDKYVIREPRAGVDYPEGNQLISFSATSSGNTYAMPQNMYYSYGAAAQGHMMSPGLVVTPAQTFASNLYPHQDQIVSGIDPHYLAAYSDNNASILTSAYTDMQPTAVDAFGVNYQNRNFVGPERNENKHFVPQRTQNVTFPAPYTSVIPAEKQKTLQQKTTEVQSKPTETIVVKKEEHNQVKTRKEKLKELHMTGTRVFSGSVEKILQWNKSLQDIGVMVLYELVGKCVSVRAGEHGAKNLVVRDESGPAIQVVYYEIDCALPELLLPCSVRYSVVGRMLSGCSRMQAFKVRGATADDFASLARRITIAAHHVAKLCEEYGA